MSHGHQRPLRKRDTRDRRQGRCSICGKGRMSASASDTNSTSCLYSICDVVVDHPATQVPVPLSPHSSIPPTSLSTTIMVLYEKPPMAKMTLMSNTIELTICLTLDLALMCGISTQQRSRRAHV